MNLICLDVGFESTGVCVLYPECGEACALIELPDYTPFEQAIVNEYWMNAGIAAGDLQPLPKCIVEGQLLPIQCITSAMNTQEMINILNRLSRGHNSHGFVVGYSHNIQHYINTGSLCSFHQ